MKCKWMNDECALGLDCPGEGCGYYREPVEPSCEGCIHVRDDGSCYFGYFGFEEQCREDGLGMYWLTPDIRNDCGKCDAFIDGKCVSEVGPVTADWCPSFRHWPLLPNWGVEA